MHTQKVRNQFSFLKCCRATFTEILYTIMPVFKFSSHLRDWRSQAVSVGVWPCSLRAKISLDSLMILWVVKGEIHNFPCECCPLRKCWITHLCSFHKVVTICACELESFRVFHTQWGYYRLSQINILTWRMFQTGFVCFLPFHNFPSLLLPLPQPFWNLL